MQHVEARLAEVATADTLKSSSACGGKGSGGKGGELEARRRGPNARSTADALLSKGVEDEREKQYSSSPPFLGA